MSSSPAPPTPPSTAPQLRRYGKREEKKKWWNEYPLEGGDEFSISRRPAVWLTNVLSKSPRLIGWDDERMERRALEALPKKQGQEQEEEEDITEFHIGPDKEAVKLVGFGLLGIAAREVTKHLLHLEEKTDGVREEDETIEMPTSDDSDQTKIARTSSLAGERQEVGTEHLTRATTAYAQYSGEDAATMRETELYKLALRSIHWQRDNYLVGRQYADERKVQRRRQQSLPQPLQPHLNLPVSHPTFDPSALGNQQIVRLGTWFIPGPIVHGSLLPIVVALPTGPLRLPILNATVNLIPLSQGNLDRVVKERLLWFLKDEKMRELIKTSANAYISNTYRDFDSE